ncbi:hypothetical protein GGI11_001061 [Coemansia sp. RSA 2049]|nr:hypothetical protein GGI11_001061 [Coemansia sp. RSA 2049]
MYAKAIYACVADNSSEVTFDADDILVSIEESGEDGWLRGRVERTGDSGLFPAVYAELHPQSGDDLAFLRRLQAQGLLSSTLELEAFRRDLDSGLVRPAVSAKPAGLTATVSAKRSATSTTASTVSTGAHVSTATTSSSYAESIESSVSATSGFGATGAMRPQTAQHQLYSHQPPRVTHTPVATLKPPPALPPKATKPHFGAIASSSADGAAAEQARQREADAARAWEEAHLAKKPTTLSGSREMARMVSGSSSPALRLQQSQAKYERQKQSSRPEVPMKPVTIRSASSASVGAGAGRAREEEEEEQRRRDKEREEADLWEAKHGIGAKSSASMIHAPAQSARALNGNGSTMHSVSVGRRAPPAVPAKPPLASKPAVVVSTKPVSFSPPVVPPKPPVAASRSASANIGTRSITRQNTYSSERSSSYTATTAPSNPSVIPEAPALPYNASRTAIRERVEAREREEMAYIGNASAVPEAPALPHNAARTAIRERIEAKEREEMAYIGNASVIAEPPALPSRQNSRTVSEPLSLIENTMQPSPKHLINRINSVSGASNSNGFEDSFDPFKIKKQQTAGPGTLNISIRSTPSTTTIGNMATTTSPGAIESSPANSGFNRTTTHTYHASSSYNSSITTTSAGSMDSMSTIPDDALSRYAHLFNKLNKQFGKRGYLTASEVRAVVAKSRLPDDQMRHILALSDRNMDGRFGPGEFNLIMHLADSALRHDPIPDAVPVDLLHAAYAR